MYPWKYIGLIGLMLVGFFVVALYLKAAAGGFPLGTRQPVEPVRPDGLRRDGSTWRW